MQNLRSLDSFVQLEAWLMQKRETKKTSWLIAFLNHHGGAETFDAIEK